MGQSPWRAEGQGSHLFVAELTEKLGPAQGHLQKGWGGFSWEVVVVGFPYTLGYPLPGQAVTNQGALTQSSLFSGSPFPHLLEETDEIIRSFQVLFQPFLSGDWEHLTCSSRAPPTSPLLPLSSSAQGLRNDSEL